MASSSTSKAGRKNTRLIILILILIVLAAAVLFVLMQKGTYDLAGKWSLEVDGTDGSEIPLTLFVNAIQPDPNGAVGQYLVSGCLGSQDGLLMPFDMKAVEKGAGDFTVTIISTTLIESEQPAIVKMVGSLKAPFKRLVFSKKGSGNGTLFSEQIQSLWTAAYQSDEAAACDLTNLPPGIYYYVNMSVHYFYEGEDLKFYHTGFDIETNIPHVAAKVETAHGVIVTLDPDTDVFSPQVDFINSFRLVKNHTEQPVEGKPYTFTLYNALNEPIPGTTVQDIWGGCEIRPTHNLNAVFTDDDNQDIEVSWEAIPIGEGWDPDHNIGFYQILMFDSATSEMVFGSELQLTQHIIPWEPFEDETPGTPDGLDYGQSLSELPNGNYHIWINAQVFTTAGISTDCVVRDEAAIIHLVKSGDTISITNP